MDWTASESETWLERLAGERDERGHGDGHAVDHRAGRGDVHDRYHGRGAGRDRLAEDGHGDADGRSAGAAGAVGLARDAVVHGDAGGASPAAKTFAVSNTGSGSMDWTASENATLAQRVAGQRDERRHGHGDAVDHRAERRAPTRPT